MNSLAQHASQMLGLEDQPAAATSASGLRPLLGGGHNTASSSAGRLFLPQITLSAVPSAQQLYMALLDIQMAMGGRLPQPSTTTTTTTTTSSILLPVLSQHLAAHLVTPQRHSTPAGSSHSSFSSSPIKSTASSKRNIATSSAATRQRSGKDKQVTKRGRKTTGRVCAECHTDNTLQWRLGPDGQASLCNACGQRFQRRKQAMQQQQHQFSSPSTSSPACSPPTHHPKQSPSSFSHHVKQEPVAAERRSDIYSLLN